jgi:muramidase (phage lysozyme)
MLAYSEIGPALLAVSDNGYNVCVGSTPRNPILFLSYATHPKRRSDAMNSDAAGRYQFMGRYWLTYKKQLNLPDFGPESQDIWATALINECRAMPDIEAGDLREAIRKCRSRWASLPGAGYAQHENAYADLEKAYIAAGGVRS